MGVGMGAGVLWIRMGLGARDRMLEWWGRVFLATGLGRVAGLVVRFMIDG